MHELNIQLSLINTDHRNVFSFYRMVDDLHSLLHINYTDTKPPFLLVGSELGAANAMFYAQMFEK